jgi:hypothetical protein
MVRSLSIVVALLVGTGCAGDVTDDSSVNQDATAAEREAKLEKQNLDAIYKAAQANLDAPKVILAASLKAPKASPSSGARTDKGISLYGVDWFQKWPGGVSADHGWDNGSTFGKRCMWASLARFEAIMKDPPAELLALNESYDGWSGGFYNWVDDFSGKDGATASSDASAPRLWAWQNGLSKWISQTAKDGSCLLPTRKMVAEYATSCKGKLEADPANEGKLIGEMKGCSR